MTVEIISCSISTKVWDLAGKHMGLFPMHRCNKYTIYSYLKMDFVDFTVGRGGVGWGGGGGGLLHINFKKFCSQCTCSNLLSLKLVCVFWAKRVDRSEMQKCSPKMKTMPQNWSLSSYSQH